MTSDSLERFAEAITDKVSSVVADCEFCGRVSFHNDAKVYDWVKGEREKLLEHAHGPGRMYIPLNHPVFTVKMEGKTGVLGCPCCWDQRYAIQFWENRRIIMEYLSARVKETVEEALKDEAKSDNTLADLEQEKDIEDIAECAVCGKKKKLVSLDHAGICINCLGISVQVEQRHAERSEGRTPLRIEEENLPF